MALRPVSSIRRVGIALALLLGLVVPVAPPLAAPAAAASGEPGPSPAESSDGDVVAACVDAVVVAGGPGTDEERAGALCARALDAGADPAWVEVLRTLRATGGGEVGAASEERRDADDTLDARQQRRQLREAGARRRGDLASETTDARQGPAGRPTARERVATGRADETERTLLERGSAAQRPGPAGRPATGPGGDGEVLAAPLLLAVATGSIAGTVTEDGTGTPLQDACVDAWTTDYVEYAFAFTASDGTYTLPDLASGDWVVSFTDCTFGTYLSEFWQDAPDESTATPITVDGGAVTGIDGTLAVPGTISGTVVADDGGAPLADVCVDVYADGIGWWGYGLTDVDGSYTVTGLRTGDYEVFFSDCGAAGYVSEYYDDADYDTRTLVAVTEGGDTPGIDASLAPGGSISGTVVADDGGAPLADICVDAWDDGDSYGGAFTSADGTYEIMGLRATPHRVEFSDCSGTGWVGEYYDDTRDYDAATLVGVVAGATQSGVDAGLSLAGAISGTVVEDGSGTPLADICVEAYDATGAWSSWGVTDVDGTYLLGDLPAEPHQVWFYDCGFGSYVNEWYDDTARASATSVPVTGGQTTTGIDAGLSTGGGISGTVTDQTTTAPLEGICVDAWTDGHDSWGSAVTTSDGTYELLGLSPGPHYVEFYDCWAGGYANEFYDDAGFDDATTVVVAGSATTGGIDAAMGPGRSLSGTVTAADSGLGLADVCVEAWASRGAGYSFGWTDGSGAYTLTGLGAGSYYVAFYDCGTGAYISEFYDDAASVEAATLVTMTTAADVSGIDAVLQRGGSIAGTVTDADTAAPIEGVCVFVDGGATFASADTGTDGTYVVGGLRTGSYAVEFYDCSDAGYIGEYYDDTTWDTATPVAVTAPDTTTGIDAALLLGGSITGTVTAADGGQPLSDVCVDADGTAGSSWGSTGPDGTYRLAGLPSGDYVVEFWDCNGGALVPEYYDDVTLWDAATPVTVSRPATTSGIDAALSGGGTIAGTVVDDAGGGPLADICVVAEGVSSASYRQVRTAADGSYLLPGLAEDEHVIVFFDCGDGIYLTEYYDDVSDSISATPVFVADGGSVVGIDAGLSAGVSISGTVTATTGGPLEDICVSAYEPDTFDSSFATTGPDGSYVLPGLSDGNWKVEFDDCALDGVYIAEWWDDQPDFFSADPVTVAGAAVTGIDAALLRGGTITGTVTAAGTGLPIADICLYAGEVGELPYEFLGVSGPDGAYRIGGIDRTGSFTVLASDCTDGGRWLEQWYDGADVVADATPVAVTLGAQTSGIDLSLVAGGWFQGTVTAEDGGAPVPDVCVEVMTPAGVSRAFGYTGIDGTYATGGVPAGDWVLKFSDCGATTEFATEYHDDVHALGSATPVPVTSGAAVTIDAALAALAVGTGSISGVVQTSTGTPVVGSWVTTCAPDGRCASDVTDAGGAYELTGLVDGGYTVRASSPSTDLRPGSTATTVSGGGATTAPTIVLQPIVAPPTGVTVGTTTGGTGTTPVVRYGTPFPMVVSEPPCATGTVTWTVIGPNGEEASGTLVEDPPGTWTGDIVVPFTGTSEVVIEQEGCVDTISFNIYIDPSGTVKTPAGDPIEGATITLYRSDSAEGPFTVVPDGSSLMAPTNRTNPDLSDSEGAWGWDVTEGYYYVTAEKDGCVDPADASSTVVSTPVYEIPPAVTDVDLRLDCSVPSFSDVPDTHPFYDEIVWMAATGVSTGYADGTFRPQANVTRQAMAAFMYRLRTNLTGSAPAVSTSCTVFSDVPASHPFCDEIAWMAESGISTGYPDGTFRPAATVTRQAMAAFMQRLAALDGPATASGSCTVFSDVPASHPFCDEIAWMAESGISTGYPDGSFRPQASVTRQAMAAFMQRLALL